MQFSKVCFLRRPVVHFGIDIDGVFAIPGRKQLIVPDALQVGRLAAGLRRRYQQVPPILKIQRSKLRVVGCSKVSQPLIGWKLGCIGRAKIKLYAVEIFLISRNMSGLK